MKIRVLKLSKQKLATMPVNERRLLLLLGHAHNEISVFTKLLLLIRKGEPPSKIVERVEVGQTFIFLRVLLGKLHEAWELYRKLVQADRTIKTKLEGALSARGQDALKQLNVHFGTDSLLCDIRNQVSFHYADKGQIVERSFQNQNEGEMWDWYYSDIRGNSFCEFSELVVTGSVLELVKSRRGAVTGAADESAAFAQLCKIATFVSHEILVLFEALARAMVVASLPTLEWEEVEIGEAPRISTFELPFFFDEEDWRQQMAAAVSKRP